MIKAYFLAIFLFFILAAIFFFNFKRENTILEKAVSQYKEELKQKDGQIQQLQSLIDSLMSKQTLIEKRIQEKRQKKESIAKEVANLKASEVCYEFQKLGYSPTCP